MNAGPSAKRMMSEMLAEIAASFIGVGPTPEDKIQPPDRSVPCMEHGLHVAQTATQAARPIH